MNQKQKFPIPSGDYSPILFFKCGLCGTATSKRNKEVKIHFHKHSHNAERTAFCNIYGENGRGYYRPKNGADNDIAAYIHSPSANLKRSPTGGRDAIVSKCGKIGELVSSNRLGE